MEVVYVVVGATVAFVPHHSLMALVATKLLRAR
jgi:hypothetical protein